MEIEFRNIPFSMSHHCGRWSWHPSGSSTVCVAMPHNNAAPQRCHCTSYRTVDSFPNWIKHENYSDVFWHPLSERLSTKW